MGFLKKIKFWKKRNNKPTNVDANVSTEDPRTCDAATPSMDPTVMRATYTQTENRMDSGDCGGAVKDESQRQLAKKNKTIRELEEELEFSKTLTANLMLNVNSVEQQLRKYAEEPAVSWSDDCDCKQQVLAVTDLLKKFIITESDTNNSKPEATSCRNIGVDCEIQTEPNTRQRDSANADKPEIVRRLEDRNRKLSVLVEK